MHKFFTSKVNIGKDKACILGDDVKHITNVLRLRKGEKVLISDGSRNEYICSISEMDKKIVTCEILESLENKSEAPVNITLYQALPKAQKMDLIVQKCIEIGVVTIKPVITGRVVVKSEDRDISGKIERWRRISEEAAKQSGRGIIPEISMPVSFMDAVNEMGLMDAAFMPYEKENASGMRKILRDKRDLNNVAIFIGPEGGFEESEVETAIQAGIKPVTLGPRILRTETAGFVTAAIILYEIGDMGGSR
jgi:16S rRNA (uracil1498-N3)-methyltransferase